MQKYLKPKIILLSLFTILMFGVFGRFFSLLEFPDSSVPLVKGDPMIKLDEDEKMTQKFIANRNNLTKIELLLRTPGPKPNDKVKMQIADENCQKILRGGTLEKSYLASSNLYEFSFDKISDSQGKTFCMITTFNPEKTSAKALQFFTSANKQPQFSVKNLTTGEEDLAQELSLRTVHTNDHWWQNLNELSQRISQYKPWFLKNYFIDVIILVFLILSVALVVIFVSL